MASFDVDGSSFADNVIAHSHNTPVLVDFWAEWCAPCRALGPVLEKIATDASGRLTLAKVDTDACPDLAGQFAIRSLPTVVLFVKGQPVAQFSGALPESQILEFLRQHLDTPSDQFLDTLDTQLAAGLSHELAIEQLSKAVDENPSQVAWIVRLCELYFQVGDYPSVTELLSQLSTEIREDQQLIRISHLSRFAQEASESPESDNPSASQAHFVESSKAIVAGGYATGMDILLDIITAHRDKNDATEAAMRMRGVFQILGDDDPLVRQYRSKMSSVLH